MIIIFFTLWRAIYFLIIAYFNFLISSSSHSGFFTFYYCFYLLSSIFGTGRLFWCLSFNYISTHWVLAFSSVYIGWCCDWYLLLCSLLQILRHAFLISSSMPDFLCLRRNYANLASRYKSSKRVNISVSSIEIGVAW